MSRVEENKIRFRVIKRYYCEIGTHENILQIKRFTKII